MNKHKKSISLLIALVLALSVFNIVPFTVGAAEADSAVTGIDESKIQYKVLEDGTAVITGYTGTDLSTYGVKELVIPSVLDGYTVTAIGDRAFFGRKMIGRLTIPDTVRSIGVKAFAYIENLTTVNLGSSVENIGDEAFASSPVSDLTLGDSVKNIGYRAFFRCDLTEVNIPDSVETIGGSAFA
ncbi:MAG: leucine-rich repeat domain-containing protein, partial [Ruminococcus sp.]|nr:leucine-rich repeat domain-containing protein [Ruminococcus sp.]